MNEQYYYAVEGKHHGPVPGLQLRELAMKGALKRQDKVWCQGMTEWKPAASILEVFEGLPPELEARPTPLASPPPLPESTAPALATAAAPPNKTRSPGLMALASFILPGLGQLICGQDAKGLFLIIVSIAGNIVTFGLSSMALCPLMSIDAYMIAKKKNSVGVAKWEFFPTWTNINKLAVHMVPGLVVAVVLLFWVLAKFEQKREQDAQLQQNQERFLNILETAQRERGY